MMRAIWNGVVLAESPHTVRLEGNHYFPPESLRREYFVPSTTKTLCPWKGLARYYTVVVNEAAIPDAAWYYPKPSPLARRIKNYVTFWPGVRVEDGRVDEAERAGGPGCANDVGRAGGSGCAEEAGRGGDAGRADEVGRAGEATGWWERLVARLGGRR